MGRAAAGTETSLGVRTAAAALIAGAFAAMAVSLTLFAGAERTAHGTAWFLWMVGVAALAIGVLPWRGRRSDGIAPPSLRELALLAAILAVGAAFRLYRLDSQPYGIWFDEAANGLEAMKILEDPSYRPVFVAGRSQMAAMFFYYCAGFIDLFGADVTSLRLATTVLGMVAVVAVWRLGRELWSPELGLIAAALLAVSRWHVNFSRFAMVQISMTVFIPIVLWLFTGALRRESPRRAVWAGLVLGIGLQFYYSMMSAPVLLGVVAGRRLLQREARRPMVIALLALTLGATAFSYSPVAQYASEHGEEFAFRVRRVSVFKTAGIGDTLRLLATPSPRRDAVLSDIWRSTVAHAGMFHWRGDRNGRHNLPNHPMLDPVTGACFAIGLAYCILRFWEPRALMLLAWFGLMIASGIFSLPFEAPQAGRSIGNAAVVPLIAALPLAGWIATVRARRPRLVGLAAAAVVLAVAVAAASSWHTFFRRQLYHPHSWAAWSTAETKIGHTIAGLTDDTAVYVPAVYFGVPTIEFLTGDRTSGTRFDRDEHLPLAARDRDALIFVHHEEAETIDLVRAYYPAATVEAFAPHDAAGEQNGKPILWTVRVPRTDIAASRGWEVSTEIGGEETGRRVVTSTSWNWPEVPAGTDVSRRIRGKWRVQSGGLTRLLLDHGGPAELRVDGEVVLDGGGSVSVNLARGVHDVDLTLNGGEAHSRLRWQPESGRAAQLLAPDSLFAPLPDVGGLLARYVNGSDCAAEAAFTRIEGLIAHRFHVAPLRRPFAIEWRGSIYAPTAGVYKVFSASRDRSTVHIDGRPIVANDVPGATASANVELAQGWHDFDVCLQSGERHARILLEWKPPRGRRGVVPSALLRPPGPSGRRRDRDAEPPAGHAARR